MSSVISFTWVTTASVIYIRDLKRSIFEWIHLRRINDVKQESMLTE